MNAQRKNGLTTDAFGEWFVPVISLPTNVQSQKTWTLYSGVDHSVGLLFHDEGV